MDVFYKFLNTINAILFGSTNGWIFPYICNSNKVWSKKVQSVNGSITILFWAGRIYID